MAFIQTGCAWLWPGASGLSFGIGHEGGVLAMTGGGSGDGGRRMMVAAIGGCGRCAGKGLSSGPLRAGRLYVGQESCHQPQQR